MTQNKTTTEKSFSYRCCDRLTPYLIVVMAATATSDLVIWMCLLLLVAWVAKKEMR